MKVVVCTLSLGSRQSVTTYYGQLSDLCVHGRKPLVNRMTNFARCIYFYMYCEWYFSVLMLISFYFKCGRKLLPLIYTRPYEVHLLNGTTPVISMAFFWEDAIGYYRRRWNPDAWPAGVWAKAVAIRDGPLENLWGGGRSTKKIFAQEKIKWKKFMHAN